MDQTAEGSSFPHRPPFLFADLFEELSLDTRLESVVDHRGFEVVLVTSKGKLGNNKYFKCADSRRRTSMALVEEVDSHMAQGMALTLSESTRD